MKVLHLLFPHVCVSCREMLLPDEKILCTGCLGDIERFPSLAASSQAFTGLLENHYPAMELPRHAASFCYYRNDGPVGRVVHAMKYRGVYRACTWLGERIAEMFLQAGETWDVDAVVPVPLHPSRKAERTYNQSELIAAAIARVLELPLRTDLLKRSLATRSQAGLSARARRDNMERAFRPGRNVLPGSRLMLVDDVITTGATVHAAMQTLLGAGVSEVFPVTVALAATS